MKYDLIKITKEEYAKDILKGNLYMNPLSFFRKYENDYMDDMAEGVCGDISKNQMRQYGYYLSDYFIDNIVTDNVLMLSDSFATCNLFCMYCFFHDDVNKKIAQFDERLLQFSDTAIWIKDADEFKRRVEHAIYLKCQSLVSEYGSYGRVRYYDINEKTNNLDSRSCFDKRLDYKWQQEWRICLWSHNMRNEAIVLSIGDISDIACVISAKDISKTLSRFYEGYTLFEENSEEKESMQLYTTISNGNVISKLMSRYSGNQICKVERTDKAEALNHLSRYYELQGELDKAEEILKEVVEMETSWENYRLLIDYYLRTNKYSEAEKVYLDIVKNHLDLIDNKVDFFYSIHQFYMYLKKAYDAGIVYVGWSRAIFPEEISLAVEHDIYIGLGMSDRAIETANKLVDKYGDREILNYYKAVSYMYLLDFKNAREYVNKFRMNYYPNLQQNEYTNNIENILDMLEGKKTVTINRQVNDGLKEINATRENINKMKQQLNSICVIEDITLYAVFKKEGKQFFEKCKKIIIVSKAVHQIVNNYCATGDEYLYDIIQFIKTDDRVSIYSPALVDLIRESLNSEDDMIMLMTNVLAMEVNETLRRIEKQ